MVEDYTTFIEIDPNNHITITSATKIDWSGLASNEVAHVYKSYGVDFFGDKVVFEGLKVAV